MDDRSVKKLHLGLRMTGLILCVSVFLSSAAIWIGTRIFVNKNNEAYKMQARSIAGSVGLIADEDRFRDMVSLVRDIYENAPSDIRDADASMGGEVAYSYDEGEYPSLFKEAQDKIYTETLNKLNYLCEESAAADIFIWFPDYERHRMVFVMFAAAKKYQSEIEPPGFWTDIYEEDEEYTLSPDTQGYYARYEREDEVTGQTVTYVQCILPLYPDGNGMDKGSAFVTVDIEWKDVHEQTLEYLRRFLIAVVILTLILVGLSQIILRYSMVGPLKKVIAEEERVATELSLGSDIQKSALPESVMCHFGPGDRVAVYGSMKPAKETGGDFFDYYLIDDDHLVLLIADVSDKGVPAALFMMMSKIFIDSFATQHLEPGEALMRANDAIFARNKEQMFVTVWLGVLELSAGILRAANAGHEKPVIRRAGGEFEIYVDVHGFIAGRLKKMKYKTYELLLGAGDTLFLFTDGLTEALNTEEKMLGAEGMLRALNSLPEDTDPETVCLHMESAVRQFSNGAPQSDDLTMLCVRIEKEN
jgi:serine phosphatase RsbU (regulator of sigma subunit)